MRCVFRFGKLDRLRFVSHLDLQRYMQRALNRSGLPVAFSQGFNPHPVMSFASALAMGWESEYEVLDIKFTKHVPEREALARMRGALPEEMPVYSVRYVDDRRPVRRVAVGGGACEDLLRDALALGCDTFVTADVKYNGFLDAKALGVNLIDAGHYPTEQVVCPVLAKWLAAGFPQVEILSTSRHNEEFLYL